MELEKEQIIKYYYESFVKVDGLWFIKTEESYGFQKALDIDRSVWEILPKIQARLLKSFYKDLDGLCLLKKALETKLKLDHFKFEFKTNEQKNKITVSINKCPWHEIMLKSGRENRSKDIGDVICSTEYKTFTNEIMDKADVSLSKGICRGEKSCVLEIYAC